MKSCFKILFILFIISLSSCNVYRKIPENKRLLMDNVVLVDSSKVKSEKIKSLILQRPNAAIFGYPILADIYMTADQNPDKTYYEWIKKNKKTYRWLEKMISRKQIVQLQRYYKDINKTIQNIGKPPVYIDSAAISRSAKILQFYYVSHSYLDAKYHFDTDTLNKYKAKVNYFIQRQKRYTIRKYEQEIA